MFDGFQISERFQMLGGFDSCRNFDRCECVEHFDGFGGFGVLIVFKCDSVHGFEICVGFENCQL